MALTFSNSITFDVARVFSRLLRFQELSFCLAVANSQCDASIQQESAEEESQPPTQLIDQRVMLFSSLSIIKFCLINLMLSYRSTEILCSQWVQQSDASTDYKLKW